MSSVLTVRVSGHEDEERSKKRKAGCTAIASQVMQDPDILVNVFKFIDFTRLKLCRTVCKIWNEEICRELKNKSMSYVLARDYPRFMRTVEKGEKTELAQLVRNVAINVKDSFMLSEVTPVTLPITNLTVLDSQLVTNGTRSKLLSLLHRSASTLTSLKLPLCKIIPPNEIKKSCKLNFPVLEELCLDMDDRSINRSPLMHDPSAVALDENAAVSFFSTLINSSPRLRHLEITSEWGPIAIIMDAFKLEQLTSFSIKVADKIDADIVTNALKTTKFRDLKCLSLTSDEYCFNPSHIWDIVQRNTKSLESLSLDRLEVVSLPLCQKLKLLTVKTFTVTCLNLRSFPALSSFRIIDRIDSLTSPLPEDTFCPPSLRKVKIVPQHEFGNQRETLKNLYPFFSRSVTDWEVPEKDVEDFCDMVSLDPGNGIRRLAINGYYFKYHFRNSANMLEKIGNLRALEELTIINRLVELLPEFWESFNPEALPNNLKTFCFYNYSKLGELKKYADKLQLIQNVVLLHHHQVPLGKEAEEFFSAVPSATVRYEADIFEEIQHEVPGPARELNTDNIVYIPARHEDL